MIKNENLRVTSFDVYKNGTMKMSSLHKYMQDTARLDLDSVGLTFKKTLEVGAVFVLIKLRTVLYEPIFEGDRISVTTCQRQIVGVRFIRDFIIERDGKIIGEASSVWVLINYNTRRIERPAVYKEYLNSGFELCSFVFNEKSDVDDSDFNSCEYKVVFTDIDENAHLNNTRYSDICLDSVGGFDDSFYVSEVITEYIAESQIDEVISVKHKSVNNKLYFKGENKNREKTAFESMITLSNIRKDT